MLKIIISPAKKMNITEDVPREHTVPVFLDRALELHSILKGKSLADEAGLLSFGAIKSSAETALLKNWMKCRYKNSILSLYGSSVSW